MKTLVAKQLDVTAGDRLLVENLNLTLEAGSFVAVLGCNGAGKTSTLHVLAGLAPPAGGQVLMNGMDISQRKRRQVARELGVLMQEYEDPFPATVMETALVGRHPHLDFWQWEGPSDVRLAQDALSLVGLEGLQDRDLDTLSGGERRRLAMATLLVQDPLILLLDEPVSHLDPSYQLAMMRLLRQRADQHACVVASLHDVNAAARFCDQSLLLFGDGRWLYGPTASVLTEKNLGELYGLPMRAVQFESRQIFVDA
ncbi:MAG: ABC transporter ATP-binding protein [Gammaproteobacteria bacterium]